MNSFDMKLEFVDVLVLIYLGCVWYIGTGNETKESIFILISDGVKSFMVFGLI